MVDTDRDGILDLVSTTYDAGVYVFKGLGDNKFEKGNVLKFKDGNIIDNKIALYMSPLFMDWDSDGDLDLGVMGHGMKVFINEGTDNEPKYNPDGIEIKTSKKGEKITGFKSYLFDWDSDGKSDLITSRRDQLGGGVVWYRNSGSNAAPEYAEEEYLIEPLKIDKDEYYASFGKETERAHESAWPADRWQTCVADYNADGKLDILVGDSFYEVTEVRTLTEAEKTAKNSLLNEQKTSREESRPMYDRYSKIMKDAAAKGIARKDVKIPEDLQKMMDAASKESSRLYKELQKYKTTESKYFGRVWVFIHK